MTESDFVNSVLVATQSGTLRWEKLNPTDFNPPCSYRSEINVSGLRYALNVYDGYLKIYDNIGLITEVGISFESDIETVCAQRDPEAVFAAIAEACNPVVGTPTVTETSATETEVL